MQVLRLPIRVLSLPTTIRPDEIPTLCNDTSDELSPTNPFLESRKSAETKLEIALHHLQNTTARRRPNFYLISNKRGRVGRFCLFKQNFKLGEDIVGTLDFTCRTVRCVQVSVTLQCEEILVKQPPTNGDGKVVQNATPPPADMENARVMTFTKHHEVCLGLMQTQMILPVPLHVTPSFQTSKGGFNLRFISWNSFSLIPLLFRFFSRSTVTVRWRLHFEFVTTNNDIGSGELDANNANPKGSNWQAPNDIDIETMVWNLPVTLYPTAPMQALHQPSKYTATIK